VIRTSGPSARIVLLLLATVGLAACATPQLYPGKKKGAGETATVANGNTHYSILMIDELSPRAVKTQARPRRGAVPAGRRTVVFFYKKGDECRSGGPGNPLAGLFSLPFLVTAPSDCLNKAAESSCIAFDFEARVGQAYELAHAGGGRVQLKDAGSGKILASRAPITTGDAETLDQLAVLCKPAG
jgi:hypothetical protein